jgi:hypothetical protein
MGFLQGGRVGEGGASETSNSEAYAAFPNYQFSGNRVRPPLIYIV